MIYRFRHWGLVRWKQMREDITVAACGNRRLARVAWAESPFAQRGPGNMARFVLNLRGKL